MPGSYFDKCSAEWLACSGPSHEGGVFVMRLPGIDG